MEQGEYQKAIYDFSHSLQAGENLESYHSRALAYQKVKQYQKALEDWTKVLSYTPKDWVIYCYRAMIYKYIKDYRNAYNDFQHALKLNPDNPKIISHIQKLQNIHKKFKS